MATYLRSLLALASVRAAFVSLLLLAGLVPIAAVDVGTAPIDIALYDPPGDLDGVWSRETSALARVVARFGMTLQVVGAVEINRGDLGSGSARRFSALIMPGGSYVPRDRDISKAGDEAIGSFVDGGGAYVGFCAGSWLVAERSVWAETATGNGGTYYRPRDYRILPGDSGCVLYPGTAFGPLGWVPWNQATGTSLERVVLDLGIPALRDIGMSASTRLFYYGGPYFEPPAGLDGLEVWARAVRPIGIPDYAASGAGAPMIIRYRRAQGQVILFAHHPAITEGLDAEERYQSLNLLHGALSLATGRPAAPLPRP
jgi:glutamine amidotransferase-like uncharacterized protein